MSLPIRARLTLWYVALLAATLLLFAAGVLAFVAREQRLEVEKALRDDARELARAYEAEAREDADPVGAQEAVQSFARSDGAVFLYARPMRLLARTPPDAPESPPLRRAVADALHGEERFIDLDGGFRALAAPADPQHALVLTQSLAAQRTALAELRRALLVSVPAMLLLAAFGGFLLARRSLAPVAQMTADASRIGAERLADRLTLPRADDEIGRLGAVLNALLERLERSFAQQRQLVADASHELRTPIAVIRSEADVALSRERTPAEYREALDVIASESAHLTRLIDDLLLAAHVEARAVEFSLRDVVEGAARSMRTLAAAKQIALETATDGAMPMRGDPDLVRRMLLNLLDNALKFTPPGGRVGVETRTGGGRYVVAVHDSGSGIPAAAQPRVFDRFFRADRSRAAGAGSGLGLSIARSIAELHGGELRLAQSDETGSTFEVTLPDFK